MNTQNITERIISLETACEALGIKPSTLRTAYEKLTTIIKALNEDWFPDFENSNQKKWYNYFKSVDNNPVFDVCYCLYSAWSSPSALYLKNEELARHAAKIALKEYQDFWTGKPEQIQVITSKPQETKNETNILKQITMKIIKTKELDFKGEKRNITVVVMVGENGQVSAGYSVKLPEDKDNIVLSEAIATGRAQKEKTNLTLGMYLGVGAVKKYILHAIADEQIRLIGKGVIVKGIKPLKQ